MRVLLASALSALFLTCDLAYAQISKELRPVTYTSVADLEPAPADACADQSMQGFVLSNKGRLLLEERPEKPRVLLRRGGEAQAIEFGITPKPTLDRIVAAVPSRLKVTMCGQFGSDLIVVDAAIFPELDDDRYAMPTRIAVPLDTLKLKMTYEIADGEAAVESSMVAATTQNLQAAVIDQATGQETLLRFAFYPVTGELAELLFGSIE